MEIRNTTKVFSHWIMRQLIEQLDLIEEIIKNKTGKESNITIFERISLNKDTQTELVPLLEQFIEDDLHRIHQYSNPFFNISDYDVINKSLENRKLDIKKLWCNEKQGTVLQLFIEGYINLIPDRIKYLNEQILLKSQERNILN